MLNNYESDNSSPRVPQNTFPGTQQVLNTVPRSASGRRPQWGDDPREELYKQLVEEQEERNKELFQENDHLRHW